MSANSDDDTRRRNGMELPWNELQVATWFLFPTVIAQYFGLLFPLLYLNTIYQVIPTIFFMLSSITAFYGAYMTCTIDPIDDNLVVDNASAPKGNWHFCCHCATVEPISDIQQRRNNTTNNRPPLDEKETIYCYVCEDTVHVSSKHCRFCNKCVKRFDHHCKFLLSTVDILFNFL